MVSFYDYLNIAFYIAFIRRRRRGVFPQKQLPPLAQGNPNTAPTT